MGFDPLKQAISRRIWFRKTGNRQFNGSELSQAYKITARWTLVSVVKRTILQKIVAIVRHSQRNSIYKGKIRNRKSKERVSLFKLTMEQVSWRNKHKDKSYWQFGYNDGQRKQKATISSMGLKLGRQSYHLSYFGLTYF